MLEQSKQSSMAMGRLAQSHEKRRLLIHVATALLDAALMTSAFYVAASLYPGPYPERIANNTAISFVAVYMVLAAYNQVYSHHSLQRMRFAVGRVARTMALTAALVVFITFYTDSSGQISRMIMALGVIMGTGLMVLSRDIIHRSIVRRLLPRINSVLVIRDGGAPVDLPGAIVLDAGKDGLDVDLDDPATLDRFGAATEHMDRVIVSCPVERRTKWAFVMRASGVNGELTSHALSELRPIGLRSSGDFISFVVSSRPLGLTQRAIKRAMDLALAGGALLALSPLLLLIALAIKLEDGGPIFFVQRRMGRGNRFFDMIKFRSMRVEKLDAAGNRSASRDDDRITRIGALLRRTSLDEVPQLINVALGQMSLVGPRPHALGSLAGERLFWEVEADYWHRHSLKPGLTGLAQIRGLRGATDEEHHLSDRLAADLEYIATWSPWNDLWIMLLTARVLVHDRAF